MSQVSPMIWNFKQLLTILTFWGGGRGEEPHSNEPLSISLIKLGTKQVSKAEIWSERTDDKIKIKNIHREIKYRIMMIN